MSKIHHGAIGLGVDAGGTETRWSLAAADGSAVASGRADGMTALQMGSPAGRAHLQTTLSAIAARARAEATSPSRAIIGMTGFGGNDPEEQQRLIALLATSLGMAESAVSVHSDVEIAYLDIFAPGEGYLVYAGTGSIGAYIDEAGAFQRVGGHGGILDDAGSGFWIAVQALRQILREEDESPSSLSTSVLSRAVFNAMAKDPASEVDVVPTWAAIRRWVYDGGFEANRGRTGRLAVGVAAAAAEGDQRALAILEAAGRELGRLASVLSRRFGPRPVAMGGRVFTLHPAIESALRATLGEGTPAQLRVSEPHHAAARIAAKPR